MALSPGEKLGPYEILSAIGAGGMGEVYKARDTRLNRTVAIKVLPDHIAQRGDMRARFEREARAVASMNHPHICSLFDIGPGYMVMELIEGETLSARIEKGPLPLDQALRFATQIADALDRAHRAGVTHRDIKPQNIMLTRDGVKVLDFGLAKSTSSNPAPNEATLTASLTAEGMVLGTPPYMAPEQFEGNEAGARSDIWAFGAVLYEMVTGARAFRGKNHAGLVSAILSADPPPMAAKPFTPAWLERMVRRCLAKDPEDRWQSMRDVVIELRTPPRESASTTPSRSWLGWIAAGAFALAFLIAGAGWYRASRPAPPRPLIRLHAEIAAGTPLARANIAGSSGGSMFALSPDGARLALTLRGADGKVRLHTRLMNQSQVKPLAGTEDAYSPFFSPAGDWIGFFTEGHLKKVAVEGGAVVTLCGAPQAYGGSWGDDDNIVVSLGSSSVLSRVPSNGGSPVQVTKLNTGEVAHRWPQVLPGSQAVLFTAATQITRSYSESNIDAIAFRTGERKTIQRGGFYARYLADPAGSNAAGQLIYLHQSTLFAAPFHAGRLAVTGSPSAILEDVGSTATAGGDFAFARSGTFIYFPVNPSQAGWPISWLDSAGKSEPLYAPRGEYYSPRFSPDGKRLAFSISTAKGIDIWVKELDRDTPSRLSFLAGGNSHPVWTPDGKHIVFRSTDTAAPGLYAVRSDGSGEAQRLTKGKPQEFPSSFSPDGKRLAIARIGNGGSQDILTMPVQADGPGLRLGEAELFLGTPFFEGDPVFSPDGRWLAFVSNESGTAEVYVRPFPGPGGRSRISMGGGRSAVWSRAGRELLFEAPDQRVMAVTYSGGGQLFAAGKPRVWTQTRMRSRSSPSNFDLAPDGKRLAATVADDPEGGKPPTHLTFLLNFFDELRRKAPEGK